MKINGFEYTDEEIMEALRQKGYLLLPFIHQFEDETFPNGKELVTIPTKCAIKGNELPSEENIWTNVAIKEFQKFSKPPLV